MNDFDRRYHPTTNGQLKYERDALVGHGNRYISNQHYFFNSLPAKGGHDRPLFNELRASMVSPQIFVHW